VAQALTIYALETQPIMIEGLKRVFESEKDLLFTGANADVETAAAQQSRVLLLGQPPASRSILPLLLNVNDAGTDSLIVLWVSFITESEVIRCLQLGVRGIVAREQSPASLLDCIRTVDRGSAWVDRTLQCVKDDASRVSRLKLTPREREIVMLIAEGCKNKQIGALLGISAGTVKVHLMHIFEKTGVSGRYQLAIEAKRLLTRVPGEDVQLEVGRGVD
jgi:DNA-binding NarL/FixJ family response regulator